MGQVVNTNYVIDMMWDMNVNELYMMESIVGYSKNI